MAFKEGGHCYDMRLQGIPGDTSCNSDGLRFQTMTQSADALNLARHGPLVKEQPAWARCSLVLTHEHERNGESQI